MQRAGPIAVGLLLLSVPAVAADKQIRPFAGVGFAGETTFVDLENAVACPEGVVAHCGGGHRMFGVDALVIGNIIGVEADVAWGPGFFHSSGQHLVVHSNVTTFTGSVVVALPRRLTEYTLRPYLVAGAGVMHVGIEDVLSVLPVKSTMPAWTVGAGAIGFLTNSVGLAWDVRRFGNIRGVESEPGTTVGGLGRLSFWRVSMGLVFRY